MARPLRRWVSISLPLIPAKAGTQGHPQQDWIPACAGMSGVSSCEQFVPEIAPARIILFDELYFPGAVPFFHLTFAEKSRFTAVVFFEPYQNFDTVPFCESG